MSAPERIWADEDTWYAGKGRTARAVEYRRADLPATDAEVLAHPKVKALVETLQTIDDVIEARFELFTSDRDLLGNLQDRIRIALAAIQEAKQ